MEDIDLYSDLPSIHLNDSDNQETKEKQTPEEVAKLIAENQELRERERKLLSKQSKLETNFSSLLITAKEEIERKDRAIAELRKRVDNLTFRRNQRGGYKHENWTPRTTEQNQAVKLQDYPSWNGAENEQYQTPHCNPAAYQNLQPSDNYSNGAENQQYTPSNDLYLEHNDIDEYPKTSTSKSIKLKQDLDEESDDEHINKTQYRSTVYGERLRKKLAEEAENNRKIKEKAEKEKKKAQAENEQKKIKEEELEIEKKKVVKVEIKEKTKEEESEKDKESERKEEADMERRKNEESEFSRNIKKEVDVKAGFVDKNSRYLQSREYDYRNKKINSNYDKNMESRSNILYSSRHFENKTDHFESHRDHRRRDYGGNYKYNHYNNSEHNNRYDRFKNPQDEKSEYSRSSDYHRSRNREKSKSPCRRRGRSHHHKSRHRGRSNSSDKNRNIRHQKPHYKERSISVDRVVVGLRYNQLNHKERSNSSDRNKENCSNSKPRCSTNKDSSRSNKSIGSFTRDDHEQLRDKHPSPSRFKSHEKDKEHCSFENKEKHVHSEKFKIPKLKRQSTSDEKLPEKSTKRKVESTNSSDKMVNKDSSIENSEVLPEKRRMIDKNRNVTGHVEIKKEKINGECSSEKEKLKENSKSKNLDDANKVPHIHYLEKVVEEIKTGNNKLDDEIEDGEILETSVSLPEPKSVSEKKLENLISTEKHKNSVSENIIEKQALPLQDNKNQESINQEIKNNVENKNYAITKTTTNTNESVLSLPESSQKDEKIKNNILHSLLTNKCLGSPKKFVEHNTQQKISDRMEVNINSDDDINRIKNYILRNKFNYDDPSNIKKDVPQKKHDETLSCIDYKSKMINLCSKQINNSKNNISPPKRANITKTIIPKKVVIKYPNKNNNTGCSDVQKLSFSDDKKNTDIVSQAKRAEFKINCNEVKGKTVTQVSKGVKDVKSDVKQAEFEKNRNEVKEKTDKSVSKSVKDVESEVKQIELQDTCANAVKQEKVVLKVSEKEKGLQAKQTESKDTCTDNRRNKIVEKSCNVKEELNTNTQNLSSINDKIIVPESIENQKKLEDGRITGKDNSNKKDSNKIKDVNSEAKRTEVENNCTVPTGEIVQKIFNKKTSAEPQVKLNEPKDACVDALTQEKLVQKDSKKEKEAQPNKTELENSCTNNKEEKIAKVFETEKKLKAKQIEPKIDCIKNTEKNSEEILEIKKFIESQAKPNELQDNGIGIKSDILISESAEQPHAELTELDNFIKSSEKLLKKDSDKEKKLEVEPNYPTGKEKILHNFSNLPVKSRTEQIKLQDSRPCETESVSNVEKKSEKQVEQSQEKANKLQNTCTEIKEKSVEEIIKKNKQLQEKQIEFIDKKEKVAEKMSRVEKESQFKQTKSGNDNTRTTDAVVLKILKMPKQLKLSNDFTSKTGFISRIEKDLQVKKMIPKDTHISLKEKIVDNAVEKGKESPMLKTNLKDKKVPEKEEKSQIKLNKLVDDYTKAKEKFVGRIPKEKKDIEPLSKLAELENSRVNGKMVEKLCAKEKVPKTNKKKFSPIYDKDLDFEPAAKLIKLNKDDGIKEKENNKKEVANKKKDEKSEAKRIKVDDNHSVTKGAIVQKIFSRRSSTETEVKLNEPKDTCVDELAQEKVVKKVSKKEKEAQAKKTKLEDNCTNNKEEKIKEKKLECTNPEEKVEEKISKKEKDAMPGVDKKTQMKPLFKIPQVPTLDIFTNKKPMIKVPVPKNAKNVIVVRRRRRPVQLSNSPPVLIVDESGKKIK